MLDAVTKGYLTLHPASAARTLTRIDRRDAAEAFSAMPRQLAAQVLECMEPASAGRQHIACPGHRARGIGCLRQDCSKLIKKG